MNKNILKSLLSVAAVALMCLGCESGYYNENYLDGYEKIDQITDVQTIELTLEADHYAAIAKNSDNKDIAQEDGEDTVAALNAIGKNKYFATADEAAMFIPAYLNQLYPTYDDGSVALVTYTTAVDVPADVVAPKEKFKKEKIHWNKFGNHQVRETGKKKAPLQKGKPIGFEVKK